MKILFVLRSTVYVRNFESTIRHLAARGHRVQLVAPEHRLHAAPVLTGTFESEYATVTYRPEPEAEPHGWTLAGEALRRGVDYMRYLGPEYRDSPKLRARAERTAPPFVTALLRWPVVSSATGRSWLDRGLRYCDRALPRDPAVDRFVLEAAPDLMVVTPLVEPGSPQTMYVRSARAAGIPTALCVYSWDNLTNKGLIQDPPDLVTVWNDPMKQEAVTLHGVPSGRVVVTGAPAYDHWFSWQPRWTREAFCEMVGLAADRPFLLYVCSSKFIAPDEVGFLRRWVQQVREHPALRDVGVLVRPHPQNSEQWQHADLRDLGGTAVWPPAGRNPIDGDSRAEYYDSIFHSAAVVGVNTSAQIESAIVGRPVHTVLAPEFRDTQEGTLHFGHISSGLLHVAGDMVEHAAQLAEAVQAPARQDERARAFLQRFVRPFGLDQPAAPRLVEALERVAAEPLARRATVPAGAWLVRRALRGLAARYEQEERQRRDEQTRRERRRLEKQQTLDERRAAKEAARERAREERRERLALRRREKERKAEARAAKSASDEGEAAARAFDHYLEVRVHAERMRAIDGDAGGRSTAEQRMIDALQPLWDATPEVIAALRHHTAPVAGLSPADYLPNPEVRKAFFTDLRRLAKVGDRTLLVPESPLLGGFGHAAHATGTPRLYNDDTLKYFEVLSALECGAILGGFRRPRRRPIVWEIGGGWGGLAFQFKTLFPQTTYVITAPPELLLISAVYLKTAFPRGQCRFYDERPGPAFWRGLEEVDFAFAPEAAVAAASSGGDRPLDLTLDVQALERMPGERACMHVRAAFALQSQYLYSLGPRDVPAGSELTPVARVLERLYWAYEIPVPQYDGMKVLAGFRGHQPVDGLERVHRLGWRRLRT